MLSLPTAKDRFSKIYADNLWGGQDSLSGPGSSLECTQNLRDKLPQLVREHEIRSIVDAPCGDFAWMRLILPDLNVNYIGCDIVESVIKRNNDLFSRPGTKFSIKDICADRLPDADLIIVRDCLFHLSMNDINRFLRNLHRTDFKYLLTTTHSVDERLDFKNADIETGDFRILDLFSEPFGFDRESILAEIEDYLEGDPPRTMVLVARKDVPATLNPGPQMSPAH